MKNLMIVVLSMLVAFSTPAWATTGSICDGSRIVADQSTSDGWRITTFTTTSGDVGLIVRLFWRTEIDDCDAAFTVRDAADFYEVNPNLPADVLNQQFVDEMKASKPNTPIGWVDISLTPQPSNVY